MENSSQTNTEVQASPLDHSDTGPMLKAALGYAALGWPVLPLHTVDKEGVCGCRLKEKCSAPGKHPRTKVGVKDTTTDPQQIRRWWEQQPEANIGIATGNGRLVVDIDPRNGGNDSLEKLKALVGEFPETPMVMTGGGGQHFYFQLPKGNFILRKKLSEFPGIDFQSNNHYVVAPQSLHRSGNTYEWELSSHPDDIPLAEIPPKLLALIATEKKSDQNSEKSGCDTEEMINEGERNSTLTSLAGTMRQRGMNQEAIEAALIKTNDAQCKPPLPPEEVKRIAASVSKYEAGKNKKTTLVSMLTKGMTFFHDDFRRPYVAAGNTILPVDGDLFSQKLVGDYYRQTGDVLSGKDLKDIIALLSTKSVIDGPQISLHIRFAQDEQGILIDMGDPLWRALRVSKDGYEILAEPPITFKRFNHQQSLPEPESGGRIEDLLQLINVKNHSDKLLLLCWICVAPFAKYPRPGLVFYGPQGAGKSNACKMIRRLLDPSASEFLELVPNVSEMAQMLDHHAIPVFDNQGYIKEKQSNLLCKAITGGCLSKRMLYSNDTDFMFHFKRAIIFNGINLPSYAPDFLDRLILIGLKRIPKEKSKPESVLFEDFNDLRPRLWGAVLNTISEGLRILPTIKLKWHHRMADFTVLGAAMAVAMGYREEDFLNALQSNVNNQLHEVLNDDPIASALVQIMEEEKEWEGAPTELYVKMENSKYVNKQANNWPRSVEAFGKRLRIITATLAATGIIVDFHSGRSHGRVITIKKHDMEETLPVSPTLEGQVGQ